MTCCSLIVAFTLSMGFGEPPERATGAFSTPMFLRGQPVWVTPISRRRLLQNYAEQQNNRPTSPATDVAIALA